MAPKSVSYLLHRKKDTFRGVMTFGTKQMTPKSVSSPCPRKKDTITVEGQNWTFRNLGPSCVPLTPLLLVLRCLNAPSTTGDTEKVLKRRLTPHLEHLKSSSGRSHRKAGGVFFSPEGIRHPFWCHLASQAIQDTGRGVFFCTQPSGHLFWCHKLFDGSYDTACRKKPAEHW